jgi:proteasome lid subunit RPN8/RPN11
MSTHYQTPDVRQLAGEGLPGGDFPATHSDFRVHFNASAHRGIVAHAAEDKSVEIGGVLVGLWKQDANGPFVVVSDFIRCDAAAKKAGEITFTHEAWNTINREMDTRHVDRKIVGWYHSHPNFGIFLSERDVFIHEHFFSNPGQVAMVVDPLQKTEGVFVWHEGKPKPCSHYWIGEELHAAADPPESKPSGAKEPAAARTAPSPPAEDMSFWAILYRVLPLVAAFVIGYLLAGMKTSWEQQRIVEGTVAHFGTWKCLRPGLRENLGKVSEDVRVIQLALNDLADRDIKAAGEKAADEKAKWDMLSLAMRRTEENLQVLGAVYGFDAAEMAAWKALFADKVAELNRPAKDRSASEREKTTEGKSASREKSQEKAVSKPPPSEPKPQSTETKPKPRGK